MPIEAPGGSRAVFCKKNHITVMGRRRNRDRQAHSSAPPEAAASSAGPSSWLPGTCAIDVEEPTRAERERLEQLIASGHYRLRFPPDAERAFQVAEAPARRRLLGVCGVVGLLGYWLGSAHDAQLMPDAAVLAAAKGLVPLPVAAARSTLGEVDRATAPTPVEGWADVGGYACPRTNRRLRST